MRMIQLQRSFALMATINSSSSSSALPLMANKYRVLHNYPGTYLSCSPFDCGGKYRKFSQIKLKRNKVSCMITTNYSKIGQSFHHSRCRDDGSGCTSTVQNHLKLGFCNSATPVSIFGYGSLDYCIRAKLPNCKAFGMRLFSQVPRVPINNDNVGARDGRSGGNTLANIGINKHWSRAMALAAHSKNRVANSSILASKDVNTVSSSELLVGDGKDANLGSSGSVSPITNSIQDSNIKGKQKQQSRRKKNKEQVSAANALEESAVVNGSKSASQEKKSNIRKSCQSTGQASEKISTGNTPVEVLDCSASTKQPPKKKSGKGKSVKEASQSPQKQKQQAMVKIKPQEQRALKLLYPPTKKSVLVVESVTKAKVIQGYLGDMFEVLPSYGHVRDLAARSGSVRPDDDFSMVWEVPSVAWTHLKSIKVALSGAENLILASDPDREGEAISWHIIEMLQQQDALREDISVARVVFHEITEASIKNALQAPREIDVNLVHAYLARRALDYLIGFNISPLLWRKLPGCQSAGRVQSAALSLICDREMEIDEFKPQEYWTIGVEFNKRNQGSLADTFSFPSQLTVVDSEKLNQHSISSHAEAEDIEQKIHSSKFQVLRTRRTKIRKNPSAPYITSTLQQDAANKLHFSALYTMKLAQKLYEGVQISNGKAEGLITYIRTDGLQISSEAMKDIHSLIIERYGQDFASESGRKYFKKVKNAQEAHEAIRPTNIQRLPSMLVGILDEDSLKLYTLIWSRTVACQMEPATIDQIQVDIGNAGESIALRSACSRIEFSGYQAAYEDAEAKAIKYKENEGSPDEAFGVLSSLKRGDPLYLGEVELKQHHTEPPPRYSEGALVKKLEELGIGRPSTYATTLKVLQDRNYVAVRSRTLYPEFRGRMVSAFLSHLFTEVTDYSFTADMETELDNVSAGLTEWKGLLRDYWSRFSSYCDRARNVHINEVEKMLGKKFGKILFAFLPDNNRTCPACIEGSLIFKVSRFGAGYFIGCDQHPRCKYIAKKLYGDDEDEVPPENNSSVEEPKVIGLNPGSNEKILLKNGPYGFYIQLGEDMKGYLPKRAPVPQIKPVDSITLEDALELLRYPVTLGNHPNDGQPIILKLAKVGFSIRHRRTSASIPKNLRPDEINVEIALELLSSKDARKCGRPKNKPKLEEVEGDVMMAYY